MGAASACAARQRALCASQAPDPILQWRVALVSITARELSQRGGEQARHDTGKHWAMSCGIWGSGRAHGDGAIRLRTGSCPETATVWPTNRPQTPALAQSQLCAAYRHCAAAPSPAPFARPRCGRRVLAFSEGLGGLRKGALPFTLSLEFARPQNPSGARGGCGRRLQRKPFSRAVRTDLSPAHPSPPKLSSSSGVGTRAAMSLLVI